MGKRLDPLLKNNAEIIGGIVLIIIGLKILNEHTNIIPILNIF
ncbi:manganese efflux pump [Clostridium homopropionicum]|nr:manganese efflux pump [Clostridium homopropionicum]